MAQRIKKQIFRILPLSVVGLMVFAMAIGIWQGLPTNKAQAAAATVVSAEITGPTQITVVYTVAVDAVFTDYSNLIIDATLETSVDSMTGTGTDTHVITFTPDTALTTASTGVVDIAALADGGSGNTFVGQAGQVLTDGQAPVVLALVVAPNSGTSKIGDTVVLNITADAAGYTATNITLNGVDITASNFIEVGGGVYSADYIISDGDSDVLSGAITASVVFTDAVGNTGVPFTTVDANTLVIDANLPVVSALIVAPNTGTSKVGDAITATITAAGAQADLSLGGACTINSVDVSGSFSNNADGTYDLTYNVAEFDTDVPSGTLAISCVLQEPSLNTVTASAFDANTLVIDANSPIIGSVVVAPDGVTAQIGDSITATIIAAGAQTDLSLAGACTINALDVSGSFANNLDGTYTLTYVVGEGDGDVGSGILAISCALQETSLNTVTVSAFDVNTLAIDATSPTLTFDDVYSDNTFDPTLAGVGKVVIVEVTPSEPLMSLSVNFNNPGFGVIPAVDDGTGCDALLSDDIWTACAPVTGNPPDSDAVADFTIDMTDLAGNPASIASGTLGSSVTVETIAPALARVTTKTQSGAFPSIDSVLWYNYTGDTFEAYVEGDVNLSEVRVCIKSLTGADPNATCDDTDFGAGVLGTDYISSGPLGISSFTFSGTTFAALAGGNPLVDMTGYSMNVWIADEAGNVYISLNPADAFVMVWNVEPSALDPLIANAGTTSWATIDDFTDATAAAALTFRAENPPLTLLGELSFPMGGSIDLTDPATVTALQAFATNVVVRGGDAADGAVDISVNAGAIAALNQPADLTISVPGAPSQPGMIVYDDTGAPCGAISNTETGPVVVCGDTISAITWNAGPETLTFSTDGFSGFGADLTAPTVDTYNPADNATGVSTSANLVLTFDEDVQVGSGDVVIYRASDDSVVETITLPDPRVTFSGVTATINPAATLANSIGYYVEIENGAILDLVANEYAGIADTTTWNFTTAALSGGGGSYNPPPATSYSVVIANGAAETTTQTVSLALSGTNATSMMISNSADFAGAAWETYATSKTWTLTDNYGTKTVYAKFRDSSNNVSTVASDAISYVETITVPIEPGELILQDPTPADPLPPEVQIGTLIKLSTMSSVYFIDQDNRRHAFPNEAVYLSYYPDFSGVQTVSSEIMASIPLGSNVTMRPGTWLVKIQSDPKVYAIAPYGVLNWVSSENIAVSLYGADWGGRIVDVAPTFFINYQIGAGITANVHPTGSAFSYLGDNKVYYVDNGVKRYISADVFYNNKFQNKFIIRNLDTSITYEDGSDFPALSMDQIITLR